MRASVLALVLCSALGCARGEPERVRECRALKSAGFECVEYKTLEEALASHSSEQARKQLSELYARGERQCKVRARETWSHSERNKLGECYQIIQEFSRGGSGGR